MMEAVPRDHGNDVSSSSRAAHVDLLCVPQGQEHSALTSHLDNPLVIPPTIGTTSALVKPNTAAETPHDYGTCPEIETSNVCPLPQHYDVSA